MMEGISILSKSIIKVCDGVYGFGTSKAKKIQQKKYTNLCPALRGRSLEDLERIEKKKKRVLYEQDIVYFLKVLRTKKNILCFFPYRFDFEGDFMEKEAIDKVMKALYSDLKESLLYRLKTTNGFDTYLTTLFTNRFLVFKYTSGGFELVDNIATNKIKTFENLMSIT